MQETKKYTRVSRCTRRSSFKGTEPVEYRERKNRAPEKTPASVDGAGSNYLKQTFENILASKVGCALLWKLLSAGSIDYQGMYLNLDTMKVNPIKL